MGADCGAAGTIEKTATKRQAATIGSRRPGLNLWIMVEFYRVFQGACPAAGSVYNTIGIQMQNPFMLRAIELATANVDALRGGPFGAVIVRDGAILAEGTNLVTSTLDPTAHAEITAIRAACQTVRSFQLTGCEIYTTCEPCPMCLGAIYWARPARVFFGATARDAAAAGFDDAFIYEQIATDLAQRKIPFVGMSREEALACFREWQSNPNRIAY
jgi:tRNA(Arg) A34 adenosine deaminase TadA